MEDELPTQPLNPSPTTAERGPADGIWLVSFADDDDRELDVRQISEALSRGQITPSTIVWRDGMPDWQPISSLENLKSALKRFAGDIAPPRKRRTVLGGFSADASKLPFQPKQTARVWNPGGTAEPAPRAIAQQHEIDRLAKANAQERGTLVGTGVKSPQGALVSDRVEPLRDEPHAFTLSRQVDRQQTPTAPLPKVRPALPTLPGTGLPEDYEEEPPTQRPANVSATPGASPGPVARAVPQSPQRPSRPPPERSPSRNPPAPMFDTEPISLFPESLESLPPDALLSVVAELPAPRIPSAAPAIFDVDLSIRGEVEIDLAESVAQPPDRAGDSILVGPGPNDQLIDIGSAEELRSPRAPDAASIAASAGPAPVAPPRRKADTAAPFTVEPDSSEVVSLSATASGVEADLAPARKVNYAELPLPPAAPKKRSVVGRLLVGLLFSGALLVAGIFIGQRLTTDKAAPRPAQATATAPVAEVTEPEPESESESEPQATEEEESVAEAEAPEKVKPPTQSSAAGQTRRVARQPRPVAPATQPAEAKPDTTRSVATKPDTTKPDKAAGATAPAAEPAGAASEPFSKGAAVSALQSAAARAGSCRKPGDPSGVARVNVTFSNSGRATRTLVSGPPFAGTQTGGCIAATMRSARVPPFSGDSVTVTKKVVIN